MIVLAATGMSGRLLVSLRLHSLTVCFTSEYAQSSNANRCRVLCQRSRAVSSMPPSCDTLERSANRPLHSPDSAAHHASGIPGRMRHICLHKPGRPWARTLSRLPSGALRSRKLLRRRGPIQCSEPSFSRPARGGIPWRNARTRPCSRYTHRYNFDTSRAAYC